MDMRHQFESQHEWKGDLGGPDNSLDLDCGPDGWGSPVPPPLWSLSELADSAPTTFDEGREAQMMLRPLSWDDDRPGDAVRLAIGRTARLHATVEDEEDRDAADDVTLRSILAIGLAGFLTGTAIVQALVTTGVTIGGLL